MSPNSRASGYRVTEAEGRLSEPEWPKDKSFNKLLTIAFADRIILSEDHPIVRRLRGLVWRISRSARSEHATSNIRRRRLSIHRPRACARELRTGRELRLWREEFGGGPPFDIGPDPVMVAYAAAAAISCFLELGWPPRANVIGLFAEHRVQTNGAELFCDNTLLGARAIRGSRISTSARRPRCAGSSWINLHGRKRSDAPFFATACRTSTRLRRFCRRCRSSCLSRSCGADTGRWSRGWKGPDPDRRAALPSGGRDLGRPEERIDLECRRGVRRLWRGPFSQGPLQQFAGRPRGDELAAGGKLGLISFKPSSPLLSAYRRDTLPEFRPWPKRLTLL